MNIQVLDIQVQDGTRHGYLVDADTAVAFRCRVGGKAYVHYQGAIDFGSDLRKGMVIRHVHPPIAALVGDHADELFQCSIRLRQTVVPPRPCVLVNWKKNIKTNTLEWLGISQKSAEIMLRMASSATNIKFDFPNGKWEFGGPALRYVPIGWDLTEWLIAWRENWWTHKRMTRKQAAEDLAQFNVHVTPGNITTILSRLRRVTDSGL